MSDAAKATPDLSNPNLSRFLQKAVAASAARVELRDPAGAVVSRFELPSEGEDLALSLCEDAQNDAAGKSGTQRYTAVSVGPDGKDLSRTVVLVSASAEGFGLRPEDLTKDAIIVELLRCNRDLHRQNNGHSAELFQRQGAMLGKLGEMVDKFQAGHVRLVEAFEQIESGKEERAIKRRELATVEFATRKTIETVLPLLPAAANRVLARAMGDDDAQPLGMEVIEKSLGSLTEEDFAKMIAALPHDKQPAIFAAADVVMKRIEARKRAEAEKAAREREEEIRRGEAAERDQRGSVQ